MAGSAGTARAVSTTTWGRTQDQSEARSLGENVLGLSSLDLLVSLGLVELHELGEIELGFLQDLDLLDEYVLKRENLGALLSDLLGNGVGEAAIIYNY